MSPAPDDAAIDRQRRDRAASPISAAPAASDTTRSQVSTLRCICCPPDAVLTAHRMTDEIDHDKDAQRNAQQPTNRVFTHARLQSKSESTLFQGKPSYYGV